MSSGQTGRRATNNLDNEALLPLVAAARKGGGAGAAAFDQLSHEVKPLVRSVTGRFRTWQARLGEDLEQAALMGLWEAVTMYDEDHPSAKSFSTVATYRMMYAVENLISDMGGRTAVPRSHAFLRLSAILKALEESREVYGPFPEAVLSDEELDDLTGVSGTRQILNAFVETDPFKDTGDNDEAPDIGPTTVSAEDTYFTKETTDLNASLLLVVNEMMNHPTDAQKRKDLADRWCDEWEQGPEVSARMRRAVSNRL